MNCLMAAWLNFHVPRFRRLKAERCVHSGLFRGSLGAAFFTGSHAKPGLLAPYVEVTSYSSVQQLSDNLSHDVKLEVVPQPALLTLLRVLHVMSS